MSTDSRGTGDDSELIEKAREVIRKNYDAETENHTVGAAVRRESGGI